MYTNQYTDIARDFLGLVKIFPNRPDLKNLSALMRAFARFPYENFTKIIRASEYTAEERMRLPDIVLSEHVDFGAGGTCFSLTYFFEQVLKFSGYDIYPVLCDRSYGPGTHCALVACVEGGRYLVDPGYLMDAPLTIPKIGESVQRTPFLTTRLLRLGNSAQLLLFTEREGKAKLRYRLRDIPVSPEDFKGRWLDSFDFAMMRHLCVSRLTETGQLYMRDGVMRLNRKDGVEKEIIRKNFVKSVSDNFKISTKVIEEAYACLFFERA